MFQRDDNLLNLAPISNAAPSAPLSFQKWAQAQTITNKPDAPEIPTAYRAILDEYPNIDKPNFVDHPKHGVVHEIITSGKPVKAKCRPLLPGSDKAIKGERNWLQMEKVGIVERIKPHEQVTWSSALHLVPKANGDYRSTGDFRPLNSQTELDTYPLPNLKNFTHKLRGARIFSK